MISAITYMLDDGWYSNLEPGSQFSRHFAKYSRRLARSRNRDGRNGACGNDTTRESTPEDGADAADLIKRIKRANGSINLTEKEFNALRKKIAQIYAPTTIDQANGNLDECKVESLKKAKADAGKSK